MKSITTTVKAVTQSSRFFCGLAAAVAIIASGGAMTQAATVTGQNGVVMSVYSNPFDPNNDGVGTGAEATTMTAGAIGAGTAVIESGWSQTDLVNRHDSYADSPGVTARLISSSGTATSGFMQFNTASSFNAGTIISSQFNYGPFANPTPFTMKLNGTTVQTGPGIQGTTPIQVTTLQNVASVNQLRLELGMSTYGPSGPTYAIMNEVIVLPKQLARITPTAVTLTAGTPWFGAPSAVSDLDGYGWGAFNNPSIKLDFGAPKLVDTLVVANFHNGPVNFNIKNDLGVVIGNVQLGGGVYGDFIPISLNTPVLTSFLTFDFADVSGNETPNSSAMREIMVFSVPEPTSAALFFGLGGLLLARRKR